MMKIKPKVIVNIEPIFEFYDHGINVEKLASIYHQKRGYLSGYYSTLKQLYSDGKINIIHEEKTLFGSHFHCPYSVIVWSPN